MSLSRELTKSVRSARRQRQFAILNGLPHLHSGRSADSIYHQFGFSAHGFQLSPGVGALMAELVATGATNLPITPFNVNRFAPASASHR
jgi:glycine/D-amino acid oxidase-like deaminating enzyme